MTKQNITHDLLIILKHCGFAYRKDRHLPGMNWFGISKYALKLLVKMTQAPVALNLLFLVNLLFSTSIITNTITFSVIILFTLADVRLIN